MLLENIKQSFLNSKKEKYVTKKSAIRNKLATPRVNKKSFFTEHKVPIFERLYANMKKETKINRKNGHYRMLDQKTSTKTTKRNTVSSKQTGKNSSYEPLKEDVTNENKASKEVEVKSVVDSTLRIKKKNIEIPTSPNRFLALYEDAIRRQKRSHTQERNFVTTLNTYRTNSSRNSGKRITST